MEEGENEEGRGGLSENSNSNIEHVMFNSSV